MHNHCRTTIKEHGSDHLLTSRHSQSLRFRKNSKKIQQNDGLTAEKTHKDTKSHGQIALTFKNHHETLQHRFSDLSTKLHHPQTKTQHCIYRNLFGREQSSTEDRSH
ncbi:hypothetical protein AVEN_274767-1 [Araneus ventricosus]|uniref:Uncharacterized protein n=1 Tax=Araneus ventricosus TaxID=182803 RepID=A0A4Y2N2T7_ARAVE|nr:hypothetical protein AVEN_274767-1 [Araneus ventricosus]